MCLNPIVYIKTNTSILEEFGEIIMVKQQIQRTYN